MNNMDLRAGNGNQYQVRVVGERGPNTCRFGTMPLHAALHSRHATFQRLHIYTLQSLPLPGPLDNRSGRQLCVYPHAPHPTLQSWAPLAEKLCVPHEDDNVVWAPNLFTLHTPHLTQQSWGPLARPTEDDMVNVVWVYDSSALPFHRAEAYHQFHNGIGKAFPKDYRVDLKETLMSDGRIGPTGCPELPF